MSLLNLVVVAFISEAVWETLKMIWQQGKLNVDRIGALIIGLMLCLATGFDILQLVELPSKIPYLGTILTGILISRGANFTHDLLGSIGNYHQNTKQ